jgi:ferredoxin
VVGPVEQAGRGGAFAYREVTSEKELALGCGLPLRSIKEQFFPPTEVLFGFRRSRDGVALIDTPPRAPVTVLLGVRPCDAAAPEILDRLMGWDYQDEPWFARRAATTLVALSCPGVDDSCFCTAVGLGPDSTRGADLVLTPVKGGYLAEATTPKGEALVKASEARFAAPEHTDEAREFRRVAREKVERNVPRIGDAMRSWLAGNFEHPYWTRLALRCHGCGACAAVCPTCHCFDIVDETEGMQGGVRRRNWDTCQAGIFTLHGSGHNPRPEQNSRFRQRVLHKFSIYPRRFGETLCTGCGRCARACPAGMDLPEIVRDLEELAG